MKAIFDMNAFEKIISNFSFNLGLYCLKLSVNHRKRKERINNNHKRTQIWQMITSTTNRMCQ